MNYYHLESELVSMAQRMESSEETLRVLRETIGSKSEDDNLKDVVAGTAEELENLREIVVAQGKQIEWLVRAVEALSIPV